MFQTMLRLNWVDVMSKKDLFLAKYGTSTHIDDILKTNHNDSEGGVHIVAHRTDLKPRHIDKLVFSPDPDVRSAIASHPNITSAHIDMLLKAGDPYQVVKTKLAQREDLTHNHIDALISSPNNSKVRQYLAINPKLSEKHVTSLIDDGKKSFNNEALYKVAKHQKLNDEQFNQLLGRNVITKRCLAFNVNTTNSSHIQSLIDCNDDTVDEHLKFNKNLNSNHVSQLLSRYADNTHIELILKSHPNYAKQPPNQK